MPLVEPEHADCDYYNEIGREFDTVAHDIARAAGGADALPAILRHETRMRVAFAFQPPRDHLGGPGSLLAAYGEYVLAAQAARAGDREAARLHAAAFYDAVGIAVLELSDGC